MIILIKCELIKIRRKCLFTHNKAIPQWCLQASPVDVVRPRPIRATMGAMVRGPTNVIRAPVKPVKPRTT